MKELKENELMVKVKKRKLLVYGIVDQRIFNITIYKKTSLLGYFEFNKNGLDHIFRPIDSIGLDYKGFEKLSLIFKDLIKDKYPEVC